jgi:hypothetical protein
MQDMFALLVEALMIVSAVPYAKLVGPLGSEADNRHGAAPEDEPL